MSRLLRRLDGNWNKVRGEIREIRMALRVAPEPEQKGWTHSYMQFWRTVARKGPVISATLIGIGIPVLVGAAVVGWTR